MKTIQEFAKVLSAQWEGGTRDNGEAFRYVKEGEHKEAITDIIRACHKALGDCRGNDWVYAQVENAIDSIANDEEPGDYADANVYIFNHNLKQWLLNPFADTYIEDALSEVGEFSDLYRLIAYAQYHALLDIHAQVYAGLEDLLEE